VLSDAVRRTRKSVPTPSSASRGSRPVGVSARALALFGAVDPRRPLGAADDQALLDTEGGAGPSDAPPTAPVEPLTAKSAIV
jgi:hypothetical protein